MAWTSPRTWVTNEIPTASIFNTHVRDNLFALQSMAYATATGLNAASATSFAVTALFDDFTAFGASFGFSASGSYFTCPWAGRFLVILNLTCTGQTGTAGSGGEVRQYDSTGTTLKATVTAQDSGLGNGRVSMSGMLAAAANDRILFYEYNTATGSAGSVSAQCMVLAHG